MGCASDRKASSVFSFGLFQDRSARESSGRHHKICRRASGRKEEEGLRRILQLLWYPFCRHLPASSCPPRATYPAQPPDAVVLGCLCYCDVPRLHMGALFKRVPQQHTLVPATRPAPTSRASAHCQQPQTKAQPTQVKLPVHSAHASMIQVATTDCIHSPVSPSKSRRHHQRVNDIGHSDQ